ncbi:Nucleotide-binding oligomerization domain-containing protein 2 [Vitis vinifera]|uniref:Nucleotide-binding oligomerization domain-containing protein 2 n=1 Tax=Vitis vinifera TaxID=29760 RepID=A0A438JNE5_VITVI|nr:Nucleotide-binding oligomerization domain-containing protein 2 [Vitis vinifera]
MQSQRTSLLNMSSHVSQNAEEVSFAANGITAAGLKAFDGVLQSNIVLKTLDLSGNPIGDEGAKVCSGLLELLPKPGINSAFIEWRRECYEDHLEDTYVAILATSYSEVYILYTLPCRQCLCDILIDNAGIQKLQLNSADLGDEGAKAIAEMLKKNSSLRIVELNNNMIDYSGFTSLGGALLENNTIRNIHLNGNYGGALGVAALAKGLEANKSLRGIYALF